MDSIRGSNYELKKILFESAVLFSGIFLALLLENYIDDNGLREQREKLLGELILDLDETIPDIKTMCEPMVYPSKIMKK